MRKIFVSACLLLFIAIISIVHDPGLSNPSQSDTKKTNVEKFINGDSKLHPSSYLQFQTLQPLARQVQAPAPPLEERKQFSWWWWLIGVIIALAGGMLLYILIKKNPRKDAQ